MSENQSNWPPIITGGNLSVHIVIRDVLLTILMWAFLVYGVITNVDVVKEATEFVLGLKQEVTDPTIMPSLARMERRFWIIVFLVTVLGISTLISMRRRVRAIGRPQPEPLPDDLLAANLHLSLQQLNDIRQRKLVALDVDNRGAASLAPGS